MIHGGLATPSLEGARRVSKRRFDASIRKSKKNAEQKLRVFRTPFLLSVFHPVDPFLLQSIKSFLAERLLFRLSTSSESLRPLSKPGFALGVPRLRVQLPNEASSGMLITCITGKVLSPGAV